MQIRKILVPTDLSSEGERAFHAIASLGRRRRATLVLLHVVEDGGVQPVGGIVPPPSYLAGTAQELERVRTGLEQRRARFPAGVEVVTEAIVAPSVPLAIVEHAA